VHGDIDAAYHAKHDRYEPQIVGSVTGVTGVAAAAVTLQVRPR
jgi:hypothetical protein